jgi:catechol 2,3-dioxygenase-like lactoylglutathione lyase family enzyme
VSEVTGINHITIAVQDLERSFAFYRDVMGFKPLMKHSKGAYFLAGESWFCIDLDSQTRTVPLPEYTHFAFGVSRDGFTSITQKIRSSGARLWQDNKSEGDSLYFLDPDNHKLEVHVGNWLSRLRSAKEKPWNDSLVFFEPTGNQTSLNLSIEPGVLAVARLNSADAIPEWATRSSFFSISRTSDELSIVCREADVPSDVKCERNWTAIKVRGPLDFSLTGILASLAEPLARAGVSIFAVSTFDTDYILIKSEKIEQAISLLIESGHAFHVNGVRQ